MLSSLKQLWQILSPLDKRKLMLVLVLVMVMALIEAAGVISIMPFLAVLSNPAVIESNKILAFLYQSAGVLSSQSFIMYLGFTSLLIVVFSACFKIITQYALTRFSSLQRHYFSTRLLKVYLQQNYDFFIQRNSSILIKNILSEVDQLILVMIIPTLNMLSYGVVILAMVIILMIYDSVMAISTASVLVVFYGTIFFLVRKKLAQISKSFNEANAERYHSCQEALGGIKDVIINDAKQGYIDNFEHYSRVFARHIATRDTLGQIPLYIIEAVGYGCLIVLAIVLVMSGKDVSHILPVLGLYGFAAYRMLPAAQNVYRAVTQIKFAQRIFDLLKLEFELEKFTIPKDGTSELTFDHRIEVQNLIFAYPNRLDQPVLENFNLTIDKNSSIGIVGKSGSGKSTLMDIMLGLLQPQSGQVVVDGVTLDETNVTSWQEMVGYIPQSIYLADKSVAENIAFGLKKEDVDLNQVKHVAQQAQLHEFIINQLPQGYDTVVGERGVMLSGGQKQRIGIARALYKNPQVLFMDEATSALDGETEKALNDAIKLLKGEKTVIIIAHRLTSIEHCDSVVEL